jgi:hypothetical protein
MTQLDAKATIDRAFSESVGRMFGILITNLETQPVGQAQREFQRGLEFALQARSIAIAVTEKLIRD